MNTGKFYSGRETGVGLIEVLITVLILSTALMALAALQTRSLQYNSSAYLRSQANIIAYDILEQMRASSSTNSVINGGAVVEPNVDALAAQLPGGEGEVDCAARVCTVRLVWSEPTANQTGDEIEKTTFEYVSRI